MTISYFRLSWKILAWVQCNIFDKTQLLFCFPKEQIQKYLIWIKNTLLKCRLRHTNYLLKRKHYALWGGRGWRGWNLMIFPSTKTEARIGIKMIIAKYNYLDNIHNDIFGRWKMNCQAIGLLSKTHTKHLTFSNTSYNSYIILYN